VSALSSPSAVAAVAAYSTLAAAAAAWSTFIVICVGGFFAWGQLRGVRQARQLQSILAVFQYLETGNWRRAQWFFYEHARELNLMLQDDVELVKMREQLDCKIKELSGETVTLEGVEIALNTLNNVAFLLLNGHLPQNFLHHGDLANTFRRSATFFRPYIDYRRSHSHSNGPSHYGQDLLTVAAHLDNGTFGKSRLARVVDVMNFL
jgi:hypothetical protein